MASSPTTRAVKFLSNWKSANNPRGPIAIDPATRDIVQNVYMRRVGMKDGRLANLEFDTIREGPVEGAEPAEVGWSGPVRACDGRTDR